MDMLTILHWILIASFVSMWAVISLRKSGFGEVLFPSVALFRATPDKGRVQASQVSMILDEMRSLSRLGFQDWMAKAINLREMIEKLKQDPTFIRQNSDLVLISHAIADRKSELREPAAMKNPKNVDYLYRFAGRILEVFVNSRHAGKRQEAMYYSILFSEVMNVAYEKLPAMAAIAPELKVPNQNETP